MKRVIKNQKKMKNTMYIVFGTFALLLFMITRSNPSFAEEGLLIDEALNKIAEQIVITDPLPEEDESETSNETLEEDVTEPEIDPEEKAVEGDETSQNLENNKNDKTEHEEVVNGEVIGNGEKADNDGSMQGNNQEDKGVELGTKIEKSGLENIEATSEETDGLNKELGDFGFKSLDGSFSTYESSSEKNPYVVYDEESGLITVYDQDFSYGITLQDKNLGTQIVWNDGNYYKRGKITTYFDTNYYQPDFYEDSSYETNGNSWGGGNDNIDNVNIIKGYDIINHTATNLENDQRKGPCNDGFHVPSIGEWNQLIKIYFSSKGINISEGFIEELTGGSAFQRDMKLPLSDSVMYQQSSVVNYGDYGSYWSSTPFGDNSARFLDIDYYTNGGTIRMRNYHRAEGMTIRCFKDEYVEYVEPEIHNLTVEAGEGILQGSGIIQANPDGTVILPEAEREGYYLEGWYDNLNGGEKVGNAGDEIIITEDKTIYAKRETLDIINNGIVYGTEIYESEIEGNDLERNNFRYKILQIGKYKIMDRNLGAKSSWSKKRTNKLLPSYGYYYQWENSYGFSPDRNIEINNNPVTLNSNEIQSYSNDKFNTNVVVNGTFWAYGNELKRRGPCPEGRHVPNNEEWSSIFNVWKTLEVGNDMSNLRKFSEDLLLPPAGKLNTNLNLEGIGNMGYYTTTTNYNGIVSALYSTESNYSSSLSFYYLGYIEGGSIRCMANKEIVVHFDTKGGGEIEDRYFDKGDKIGWITNPQKEGYMFDGWYISESFDEKWNFNNTLEKSMTLYAKRIKTCKVSFETLGGTQLADQIVGIGTRIYEPNPKRNYSILEGWYLDRDYTELYDFSQPVTGDLVLYAKWKCRNFYRINENGNSCELVNGEYGTIEHNEELGVIIFKYGDEEIIIEDKNVGAENVGYGYDANESSYGLEMPYSGNIIEKDGKYKIGKWENNPCEKNGGYIPSYEDWQSLLDIRGMIKKGNIGTNWGGYTTEYSEEIAEDFLMPIPTSKWFYKEIDLWSDQLYNDNDYFMKILFINEVDGTYDGMKNPTNNETAYLRCFKSNTLKKYNIVFINDGYVLNKKEIPVREKLEGNYVRTQIMLEKPADPEKKGYNFKGWYTEEDNSRNEVEYNFEKVVNSDLNLYAKWEANNDTQYTINYYLENLSGGYDMVEIYTGKGTTDTTVDVAGNSKIFNGFTFSGSNTNNITTGNIKGNGDLALKLYYDRNKYKIDFMVDDAIVYSENIKYGDYIKFPDLVPSKEGYNFKGWGNVPIEGRVENDLILTAIFEKDGLLMYSGGGGGAKKTTKIPSTTGDVKIKTGDIIETNGEKRHNSADENQPLNGDKTTYNYNNIKGQEYPEEFKTAYEFAKQNGITTTLAIENANMYTNLTRIQMAKMLSNYAINVLGRSPDTSKTVKFKDVTEKMDKQYDNAVTKVYQLGIMGQNMKNNKFRPNDEVTRAEFSATLSRLLYNTDEGKYKSTGKYYISHIAKLYNEGIINKTDPKMKEKRGYVMIMLMRTVK